MTRFLSKMTPTQVDRLMKRLLVLGWLLLASWVALVFVRGDQWEGLLFYAGATLVVDYYVFYKWAPHRRKRQEGSPS